MDNTHEKDFWTQKQIRDLVKENCYLKIGEHEDLKALCICPFAEDEVIETDFTEIIFVVPLNWLKEIAKNFFKVDDINHWLKNEYTSEESERIFETAFMERQIVMVDFN